MAANPAAGQEPPEIVALRLQLQIAEAQRDQAVAEAQVRAERRHGELRASSELRVHLRGKKTLFIVFSVERSN